VGNAVHEYALSTLRGSQDSGVGIDAVKFSVFHNSPFASVAISELLLLESSHDELPNRLSSGHRDWSFGTFRTRRRTTFAGSRGLQSGIGEALTRELINRGWFVAMADLRESKALTEEFGSKAKFYETDVASYDAQAKTFAAVFHFHGRIDALCANAGIGDRGSIYILNHRNKDEIPPAPDLKCTNVDWKGVLYGTQLAIHFMRKNATPGGVIVATASIVAMHPHPSYAEYNGTKAAVLNFVRGSAGVLKVKENIRINCASVEMFKISSQGEPSLTMLSVTCRRNAWHRRHSHSTKTNDRRRRPIRVRPSTLSHAAIQSWRPLPQPTTFL